MNGQFSCARAEEVSADAYVITQVQQFVELKCLFANGIFLHVNLQLHSALLDMCKSRFAHEADRHDASGDTDVDACLLKFLSQLGRVVGQDLPHRVGEVVLRTVRGLTERFNFFQLLAPQVVDVFV